MTQEQMSNITDVARTVLSAFGAYLLGANLFGTEVTEVLWQELTGVALGIISIVWSVLSKTVTVEMVQGTLRQLITFAGGLLLAYGTLQPKDIVLILALIPVIAPLIYSFLSKSKTKQLVKGDINLQQLKK